MSSKKFETVNRFISVAKELRERVLSAGETMKGGVSYEEVLRKHIDDRLELVLAAQAVAVAPHDPEAESVVGAVLLSRIDSAVAVRTAEEWESCAAAAFLAVGPDVVPPNAMIDAWLDLSGPIVELGNEATERADQQSHEIVIDSLRHAAEQTPGMSLRISESVGDTLISDETVFGPEPGHEDSVGHTVGRVSESVKSILGTDDDRMVTDVGHLIRAQSKLVLARNNLSSTVDQDQVRFTVCERVISKIDQDLDIVAIIGDLPSPISDLGTRHFPALRVQLMRQHSFPLSEGAVLSRSKQGDRSAQGMLMQIIVLADLLSRAEPYFLPLNQVHALAGDEELRSLPPEQSFLVWHDTALNVGEGVDIMAWLYFTDEHGNLHPVAHTIRLVEGALESGWCSLRQGQAAPIANQIARTLRRRDWETARPVRLPKPKGGKEWKKALVRSSARLKEGGLHGLRTLPR